MSNEEESAMLREVERLRQELDEAKKDALESEWQQENDRLRESRDQFRRLYDAEFAEVERLRADFDVVSEAALRSQREAERLRAALTNADHAPDCPVTLIPGDISLEQDGRLLECACLVGELWDALAGTEAKA